MRPRRVFTGCAGLALVAILGTAASSCRGAEPTVTAAATPEPRIDVTALTVGRADVESALQISGSLMPQTRVSVMPKMPGTLSRVAVNIGDRVRAGQVVAIMDRRDIDAQVDAATAAVDVARAGIESAEAGLANATLERERAQNLFDKGAVPRQRLEAAGTATRVSSAQRDLARASMAQVEAALRRAKEAQRDATITSPIDGVVVERNFDAGTFVNTSGLPLVVIADLRVMKLEAGVSELEAGRLQVGLPARVTAQAHPGRQFVGRLAAIAPEVDAKNRHFAIEVRTVNPDGVLLSGMYGTATIPLARAAQALAIPRDAVVTRGGRRVALRIDGNTVAEAPVTEGITDGALVEVVSGLASGDVIVADARRDVAIGATVNPVFDK